MRVSSLLSRFKLTLFAAVLIGCGSVDAPPIVNHRDEPPAEPDLGPAVLPIGDAQGFEARLRAEERRIVLSEGIWAAVNRATGVRASFESDGALLEARDTKDGTFSMHVAAEFIGRDDGKNRLEAAAPRLGNCDAALGRPIEADCLRPIELDRGSGVVEWWRNSARGFEHGFDIAKRDPGTGPLRIEVTFDGASETRAAGEDVEIELADGTTFRYAELKANDRDGKLLRAHVEPRPRGATLVIDDAEAVYPLRIDPILTRYWTSTASDQTFSSFGSAVAVVGDLDGDGDDEVAVGGPKFDIPGAVNAGRVYIFRGTPDGLETTPWATFGSNAANAEFGTSIAGANINGDNRGDLVIGAPGVSLPETNEGSFTLYLGQSSGLPVNSSSFPSNQTGARLGTSIARAGDVNCDGKDDVIVGAPRWASSGTQVDEGKIFVYRGTSTFPYLTLHASREGDSAGANLGLSVAGGGNIDALVNPSDTNCDDVVIGAPHYVNGQADEGRVFVWYGLTTGMGTVQALEANWANANLGTAVALGDVNGDGYSDVIAGAPGVSNFSGRIGVFYGSSTLASFSVGTMILSSHTGAQLGASLSAGDVSGDGIADVLAGAPLDSNGQSLEGAAFLYLGRTAAKGNLSTSPAWSAEGDQNQALFGSAVSIAGDVTGDDVADAIIGATSYDSAAVADEGRAYLYAGGPWRTQIGVDGHPALTVASAGDVNNDGFTDVIVGDPRAVGVLTDTGRVWIFFGSSSGLKDTPEWTATLPANLYNGMPALFGMVVAGAGKINDGDQYDDVIVVAGLKDAPFNGAYVYYGGPSGTMSDQPAITLNSKTINHAIAFAGAAGDVNGDNRGDVFVSEISKTSSGTRECQASAGVVRIYESDPLADGLKQNPPQQWSKSLADPSDFGLSAAGNLDINNDGKPDLVVGAPTYNSCKGRAYVYFGPLLPGSGPAPVILNGATTLGGFGLRVANAGNAALSGTGNKDEFVIGAPGMPSSSYAGTGEAFVYANVQGSGITQLRRLTPSAPAPSSCFGASVSRLEVPGSWSGVLVGDPCYDGAYTNGGRVSLYRGGTSNISQNPDWQYTSRRADAMFGNTVAWIGDANGDGLNEFAVHARTYSGPDYTDGLLYVFSTKANGLPYP